MDTIIKLSIKCVFFRHFSLGYSVMLPLAHELQLHSAVHSVSRLYEGESLKICQLQLMGLKITEPREKRQKKTTFYAKFADYVLTN